MNKPKFIVIYHTDSEYYELRSGRVELHVDLKPSNLVGRILGGGWWHVDLKNRELLLYNQSIDFGRLAKEQVLRSLSEDALYPVSYDGFDIYFSESIKLEDALVERELIKSKKS